MQHGAVPIVEMLQVPEIELQNSVLKVVNQIVAEGNRDFQELFSMVGLIPGVIKFAHTDCQKYLRAEVGKFISHLCKSSESSLQMLVACGGLEAIVQLISSEYFYNRDLVYPALDDVNTVLQGSHSRDLCRILAKHGICDHLVLLIDTLASDMGNYHQERATIYLRLVVSLLVKIAKTGDAVVKAYMAKATVLEGLIASLEFLSPPLVLEICQIFTELSTEPSVLNMLENSGLVPVMVNYMTVPAIISDSRNSLEPQDVCTQCLLALSNLCKLSRPRQEQAALAGAIPKLQAIVERQRHPWREHAFLLLCEMTCASLATRKKLWDSNGASFLVRSLAQESTQVPALEALVGWFGVKEHHANWCKNLETLLLKGPDFLMRLLKIFKCQDSALFLKILDPLLKLVTCSPETRTQLANFEDFLLELLRRLEADEDERPSGHLASCWKGKHMKTRWRFKKSSNNLTDTVDVVVPCSPCPEKKSVVTS
ncbi:Serine/threonine-protein kinase sepA (Septase A) [Durusdinium trenchii]|uniref:Serine/threonine-protein kinase sepA (Septase A) n=1 Tax=Durusdinium trenchii TaxID=1381693 RepID=A0ABP0JAY5_9DINO